MPAGFPVQVGSTNVSVVMKIFDDTSGALETGVTSATSGLALYYWRPGAAAISGLTESDLSALDDAHSDGGMLHIGNGLYRVDFPDAAFASGVDYVLLGGTATGMVVEEQIIPLVAYDPTDAVRLGLTALPNAAADAAGGLPISDAGGLDLDTQLAATNEVTAARMGALTDWIDGGRLDLIIDAIVADTNELQTDDIPGVLGSPAGADFAADIAAIKAETAGIIADTGGFRVKKNTALAGFPFVMVDSTNQDPAAGLTVTATRSLDGAAFAACANAVSEVSNGVYTIDLAATDLNADTVVLRFTATGAEDRLISIITQAV